MQGLVNFTTAIADGIAVTLPAFCYLAACICFFSAIWTMRGYAYHHHHHHRHRPWVPWISLLLSGVFATFPQFLTMADVSFGSTSTVGLLTSYVPTTPGSAAGVTGTGPSAMIVNVVTMFQYFFQAFGAFCVFWAIMTWRAIVNGRVNGSPVACGIQFAFGVMCMNILQVATGTVALFSGG